MELVELFGEDRQNKKTESSFSSMEVESLRQRWKQSQRLVDNSKSLANSVKNSWSFVKLLGFAEFKELSLYSSKKVEKRPKKDLQFGKLKNKTEKKIKKQDREKK